MFKIFEKKTKKTELEKIISKREKEMNNFDEAFKAIDELDKNMMKNIKDMQKEYESMIKR